jgi:hypothetical protein
MRSVLSTGIVEAGFVPSLRAVEDGSESRIPVVPGADKDNNMD